MYKEIEALIENTKFEARVDKNGNIISYRISPMEGYKLHEITLDEEIMDKETLLPTGKIKKGYTRSFVTAGANYDFKKNERDIYAVPQDTVPENQIFNNGGPEHEVASTEPNTETE